MTLPWRSVTIFSFDLVVSDVIRPAAFDFFDSFLVSVVPSARARFLTFVFSPASAPFRLEELSVVLLEGPRSGRLVSHRCGGLSVLQEV
jgi:hypothetical protein